MISNRSNCVDEKLNEMWLTIHLLESCLRLKTQWRLLLVPSQQKHQQLVKLMRRPQLQTFNLARTCLSQTDMPLTKQVDQTSLAHLGVSGQRYLSPPRFAMLTSQQPRRVKSLTDVIPLLQSSPAKVTLWILAGHVNQDPQNQPEVEMREKGQVEVAIQRREPRRKEESLVMGMTKVVEEAVSVLLGGPQGRERTERRKKVAAHIIAVGPVRSRAKVNVLGPVGKQQALLMLAGGGSWKLSDLTGKYLSVALFPGLTLGLLPANESRCYKVTPPFIGWAQT